MTTPSHHGAQPASITVGVLLLVTLLLVAPGQLWAANQVTAKYLLPMAGQEVVVEIAIGEPPPSSLIVIQNLPAQVTVIQAQPETKGVNSAKGEVKWLLSNIKAGILTIHLTLDRPIASQEISGEIRYREAGGDMVVMPISKTGAP